MYWGNMPKPNASLLVPSIMHIQILFLFSFRTWTPVAGVIEPTSLEEGLGFKGLTTVNFKASMERFKHRNYDAEPFLSFGSRMKP